MNKESIMLKVLTKADYYKDKYPELTDRIYYILNNISDFNINVLDIKEKHLYNSVIHGLNHSEKVLFFATIISLSENLNERDMQIISDAAKYHDIGRTNDVEDEKHGLISATKVTSVITDGIYKNDDNLNMLKAIIEIHSIDDDNQNLIFKKYKLKNFDHFKKMYSILKDADALDRKRFCDIQPADLNIKYLRLNISKELVNSSKQINYIYYKLINERD